MPNWKKVVTSGSNAHLNHITASGNISASGTIQSTGNISTDGSITATSADINGNVDIDGGNLTVGTALQSVSYTHLTLPTSDLV